MARPQIIGTVLRQARLRSVQGGSNKDYRLVIARDAQGQMRLYAEWGPAGRINNGQELEEATSSAQMIHGRFERQMAAKVARGYVVESDEDFAPLPLEAPIAATPILRPARAPINADTLSPAQRSVLRQLV